jgi:hypothetical protein
MRGPTCNRYRSRWRGLEGAKRIEKRFDRVDRRLERLEAEIVALRRDMMHGFMIQTAAILALAAAMVAHSL